MKFKSLKELNVFLENGNYDPFEIGKHEREKKYLDVINEGVGKIEKVTPGKVNSLLIKLEDKMGWA